MQAKLLGHPIHPILIVFPLGLLATAVAFDVVALVQNDGSWFIVSYWLIVSGVAGGVLAAIFGLIDWLGIPSGTRAKRIGLIHGSTNVLVVLLFTVSGLMRGSAADLPSGAALMFSFIGLALALVGGWLGGELVHRLAIGVDQGAHPDAPSSLSGRPAVESQSPTSLRKVA